MRIAGEVMLDRVADSPTGNGDRIAQQIAEEFLPNPGQHVFIQGDDGEAEYVVTSVNAWHEDMQPGMTEAQMQPDDASMAGRHQHSER